jgi:glycosyltransferase involved in cell wall biosynthesis
MKIALVTEWFNSYDGGVACHVKNLAQFLIKKGNDVIVITNKVDNQQSTFNFPVYQISGPIDPLFKLNVSPKIKSQMKEIFAKDVDIIHCHHAFARLPLAGIHLADKMNIPCVLTTHTVSLSPENKYLWQALSYIYPRYRTRLKQVDRIIAVSEAAKRFIEHFTDEKTITVVPNSIDINRFQPTKKDISDGKNILYVGRVVPRKGLHVLLNAMKDVMEENPDLQLLIGGKGKISVFLKAYAKAIGVEKNVRFLGGVADEGLPLLYQSSDVFVLPSIAGESFGITLLEAMASGVIPVGTKIGGIPEIIDGCGVLVEPNDSKGLSNAIINLLNDDSSRMIFRERCRKRVENDYSLDMVGDKIMKVYEEVYDK